MAKPLAKLVSMLTPKRRWAQFSLATLLLVVTVLCVGLSLVVVPAERQRRAVAAIEALGGRVGYVEPDTRASEAFPASFLRRWLARDYFDEVREVYLAGIQVTDAGMAHLHGLTALRGLYLGDTQVTDAGLSHLHGMTGLQSLDLRGTQVTDAGLAHLQGLTKLGGLILGGTQVTDAGLAYLHGLTGLQELNLKDTQVTDAGLAHLQGLTGLRFVNLAGTQVTDAGLAHLQGLTRLQVLHLSGTQVTDAGMEQLQQALPNCVIRWQRPMKLQPLSSGCSPTKRYL